MIQTLTGEYNELSSNHSRPVYQKAPLKPGATAPEVYLYYWDARDGPAFEGWWFGKSVGGNEVWSHNDSKALKPPQRGWKIPFSGPVRDTLSVMTKSEHARANLQATAQAALASLQVESEAVISEATAAVEQGNVALGGVPTIETLDAAEQALLPQPAALHRMLKKLEAQQAMAGPTLGEVRALLAKVRAALSAAEQSAQKVRLTRPKVLQQQRLKEMEERDAAALADMLAETSERTNEAEDMVEKAAIAYELVRSSSEEDAEAQRAVNQTHEMATKAQMKIKEALAIIGRKLLCTKSFQSESVRESANAELNACRVRMRDANQKLTPLVGVRQEFQQRAVAKRVVEEALQQLTPAELDVDRANEAAEPLLAGAAAPSKELMKQAETAINVAADRLQAAMRGLEARLKSSSGLVKAELEKVEERARASETRLTELRNAHRLVHERQAGSTLLIEVKEKMRAVSDSLAHLEEVLAPYLMGVEQSDDADRAILEGEQAMKAASKATSAARIVISMRLVEVKRFSAEAGQEAQRSLQEYQRELEAAMKRISDLRATAAERKQATLSAETLRRVESAEALAAKITEVGAQILVEERLREMSRDAIGEAGEIVRSAFAEAQGVIRTAQQLLTQRLVDAKSASDAGDSAELVRLQQRLQSAQTKIAAYRTLPPEVEKEVAVKRQIDEAVAKVSSVEEKLEQAISLASAVGARQKAGEAGDGSKAPAPAEVTTACNAANMAARGALRFLLGQKQADRLPEADFQRLEERIKVAQARLESVQSETKEATDSAAAQALLHEVRQQLGAAEEAVEAFCKAALFEAGLAEAGDERTGEASGADAEAAKVEVEDSRLLEQAATKALSRTQTVISVKRIAAKRLSESASKLGLAELSELQSKMEEFGQRASDVRRQIAERRLANAKEEAAGKCLAAKEAVEASAVLTEAVLSSTGEEHSEEMEATVERCTRAQQDAQTSISEARALLQTVLRTRSAEGSAAHAELSQLLLKLGTLQATLDKQKKSVAERGQRRMTQRLLAEASEVLEAVEEKLAEASDAAEPLVGKEQEDFLGASFLMHAIAALRDYVEQKAVGVEAVFEQMQGSSASGVTEAHFLAFFKDAVVGASPEDGSHLDDDQLKAAFRRMDTVGGGRVTAPQFLSHFRCRYACVGAIAMTDTFDIGGSRVRMLEVGEVVEGLEPPATDAGSGLVRAKARAERDGAQGYVSLSGNQGTAYLEPFSPYEACARRIDVCMTAASEAIGQALAQLKAKADELSSKSGGPVAEAKAELMKLRVRASKAQSTHAALRKRIEQAQRGYAGKLEEGRRRREAAVESRRVQASSAEASELTEAAVAAAEKSCALAEASKRDSLEAIDGASRELAGAERAIAVATERVSREVAELRDATRAPLVEARRLMLRLKARLAPLENRCKTAIAAVAAARGRVTGDAERAVAEAFRASVKGENAEALFKRLSGGQGLITAESLRRHLEAAPEPRPKPSDLDLGLHRYSAGISRFAFQSLLQEYMRCVKDIVLTTAFEVRSSSTLRKIERGEVVQVLGGTRVDESVGGLQRVPCRAMLDGVEGWATLRGNQGTAFLEPTRKPYLHFEEASGKLPLQRACESCSEHTGEALVGGDVVEVLEGPRREDPREIARVRGKALRDGKAGWTTLKDSRSLGPCFELARTMVCKASTALTSEFDVRTCKAIRKLEPGEVLEQIEPAREDEDTKMTRVRVRCSSDGNEGWATAKGNAGTIYISESFGHQKCILAVPLETNYASGSKALRTIETGELFEVLEGPSKELKEGEMRAHVRSVADQREGWFTVTPAVVPWSTAYVCKKGVGLLDGPDASTAKSLRTLEVGESLEALEAPATDAEGVQSLHLRAVGDGAVGFACVRGQGEVFLQPEPCAA